MACALTAVASADTPQEQADKLFAEGRQLLLAKGDAKAACEKFEAAISLDATATGTMLNLGLCYETLGKYATSIAWFRKAQAAASETHLDEYEAAAKDHTRAITAKVPSLQLAVSIPDADIRVDGKRIAATDYGRVEVDPGAHEIVGTAPGKKKVVQNVDVAEGASRSVVVAFDVAAVPVYVDRGKTRRRGAIALAGVGVGAMVASGVWGYLAKQAYDKETDPDKRASMADDLKYFGTGLFTLGAIAVVGAGVIYFTAPGREQVSDGTAFAPILTRDGFGLAASGSF